MSAQTLPRLNARTIFIDIDDTITTATGKSTNETFLSTLIKVVSSANRINAQAAHEKIRATFNPETQSVAPYYAALGITECALWDFCMKWMPVEIVPYPDAVDSIKRLHAQGYRLFPATTNSRLICTLKLAIAGLATREGSPYFAEIFGGAEVHPAGKSCSGFFSNLLTMTNTQPQEAVHVGDLPEVDLHFAKLAGIKQVVLPRRGQSEDWVQEKDGGLYVNSLEWLPKMLA